MMLNAPLRCYRPSKSLGLCSDDFQLGAATKIHDIGDNLRDLFIRIGLEGPVRKSPHERDSFKGLGGNDY